MCEFHAKASEFIAGLSDSDHAPLSVRTIKQKRETNHRTWHTGIVHHDTSHSQTNEY